MQLLFGGLFLVSLTLLGMTVYFNIEHMLVQKSEQDLKRTTMLVLNLAEFNVQSSIRSHLQAIAEKTRSIVAYEYRQFQEGKYSKGEAYQRFYNLMHDPDFGRIGETGYIAGVSSTGVLTIHPKSEGVDASSFEFMQKAVKMKNGYLEYLWKNTGEETEREKVGALAYFEPWDLIIWASSYKEEFLRSFRSTKSERAYCRLPRAIRATPISWT